MSSLDSIALPPKPEIPYGYCHCGCGEKTKIITENDRSQGLVKGEPRQYINTHQRRLSHLEYIEEDRGWKTPCWIWQRGSSQSRRGGRYGVARRPGEETPINAHILIWERFRGPVPEGCELDHLCRVTMCVNPDHLEPVPHDENVRRGVVSRGIGKITREDAISIIQLRKSGVMFKDIAAQFGVRLDYIQAICAGRKWSGVVPVEELPVTKKRGQGVTA